MKHLIILLFLINYSLCNSQVYPPEKFLEYYDFSEIETKVNDSTKLNLLRRITFSKYLQSVNFENKNSYGYSKYHILDFNGDNKLDIIYDGRNPSGIETNNIVFYKNNGDSLKPVIKLNGDFIKINITNGQLKGFKLIKYGCCSNLINHINSYVISKKSKCFVPINSNHETYKYSYGQVNNEEFCVKLENKYSYVYSTIFPLESSIRYQAKVVKENYLTLKPLEPTDIDFSDDEISFDYEGNKAISIVPKGTKCYVISEKKDNKGNVFCFIMLKNNNETNNYFKNLKNYHFGWINKKSLK